jgi:hypothetical protein
MPTPAKPTKAAMITKILSREKGATVMEMVKATGWQPHSCRAFLTGLRKKNLILKEQRTDGKLAYRIDDGLIEPTCKGMVLREPA